MYWSKSRASTSYPSMEHRKHMVHVASLTLLLVFVCTTSLQEGHWVMADLWPKLSTCPRERQRLTVCSAVTGHFTSTRLWVQVSLTWSHSRLRYHGACSSSGLGAQRFLFLVQLWQQVDPPTGSVTFYSRPAWITFGQNWFLDNHFHDFLWACEMFVQGASVTDVGAAPSLVLVLLWLKLLQLLLNGLQLLQPVSLVTDHWH